MHSQQCIHTYKKIIDKQHPRSREHAHTTSDGSVTGRADSINASRKHIDNVLALAHIHSRTHTHTHTLTHDARTSISPRNESLPVFRAGDGSVTARAEVAPTASTPRAPWRWVRTHPAHKWLIWQTIHLIGVSNCPYCLYNEKNLPPFKWWIYARRICASDRLGV